MIKKLKGLSKDKKRLVSNFFSLSVLQGTNYLLPLITLPYLVRVLDPEKFGLIALANAFIQYFILITDYGFNLSATREISIHREDRDKVSKIFCAVMVIKILLLVASFLALCIVVYSYDKFKTDWQVYFLSFGIVGGYVLFPIWLFQGMERMKYIALMNVMAKLFFTVSIFVFINEDSDYIYVPLINSTGIIIAGAWSLYIAIKNFGLILILPNSKSIKLQLTEGWHIFISTASVSCYRVFPTLFIGLFHSHEMVAYYAVAEKIMRAIVGLLQPLTQAFFPFISREIKKSVTKGLDMAFNVMKKLSIITLGFSVFVFIFAKNLVYFFVGAKYSDSIVVIRILSFLPIIVGIANIFGVQIMLNINLKREFSYILLGGGIISLLASFALIIPYSFIGAAVSVIFTECFVAILMALVVINNLTDIYVNDRIMK